jgi:high-affinity iron transporter
VRVAIAFLVVLGCARGDVDPAVADDVRRLVALLDYVGADYPEAVEDGRIVDEEEYGEQLEFLERAAALAERLGGPGDVAAGIVRIRELVQALAPAGEVEAACRALRRRALEIHGVVLAPAGIPSADRGAALYRESCVACHGATGAGDGPEAERHDPRPRSFRDPEVAAGLSPARAFSAITDGIDGTAMASFATLAEEERWSLAFHVAALRHDFAAAERGAAAFARAGRPLRASAAGLADVTDGELEAALAAAGLGERDRADALAWLRLAAPGQAAPTASRAAPWAVAGALLAALVVVLALGRRPGRRRDAAV